MAARAMCSQRAAFAHPRAPVRAGDQPDRPAHHLQGRSRGGQAGRLGIVHEAHALPALADRLNAVCQRLVRLKALFNLDVAQTRVTQGRHRRRSRQAEDDNGQRFLYFGPTAEYLCTDQCGGWKYGYKYWEQQGEWISLGYGEWNKAGVQFETPMVTQVVMLRCQ